MNKKATRRRRAKRSRVKIRELQMHRLCVNRTNKHIYAQVISPDGSQVIASSSTLDKEAKDKVKYTGNKDAAVIIGNLIAKRAKEKGISKVAFDRSGYKYHGRIQKLADAAREGGIEF